MFWHALYFEQPQLEPQKRPALAHLHPVHLPVLPHEHFTCPAPPTNEFARANSRNDNVLVSWRALNASSTPSSPTDEGVIQDSARSGTSSGCSFQGHLRSTRTVDLCICIFASASLHLICRHVLSSHVLTLVVHVHIRVEIKYAPKFTHDAL